MTKREARLLRTFVASLESTALHTDSEMHRDNCVRTLAAMVLLKAGATAKV